MPVTHRQRQVYEFISRFMEAKKQPPTIAEIGKHFKMSSSASVHAILSALEREGLIKRIPNVSRGIEVVKTRAMISKSLCSVWWPPVSLLKQFWRMRQSRRRET